MKILEPETPAPAAPTTPTTPAPVAAPEPQPPTTTAHPAILAATAPAPVIKACVRPVARPELRLENGNGFDHALAANLRGGRRVTVDLAVPYSATGTPPPVLARWLTEVRSSGGRVSPSTYCQESRGFGDWLRRVFAGGGNDPGAMYHPARHFDATLHIDALDQVVTQVEFTPRVTARP